MRDDTRQHAGLARRGRPARLSSDEMRDALVEAGRDALRDNGLELRLDAVTLDAAAATAGVSRAAAFRAFKGDSACDIGPVSRFRHEVARDVLSDFVDTQHTVADAVLGELSCSTGLGDLDDMGPAIAAMPVADRNTLFARVVAAATRAHYDAVIDNPLWHARLALLASVKSQIDADDGLDDAVLAGDANTTTRHIDFYQAIFSLFGMRIRAPYRIEQLAAAAACLAEGLALRGRSPIYNTVTRPPIATDDEVGWTLFGVGSMALAAEFCELVQDVSHEGRRFVLKAADDPNQRAAANADVRSSLRDAGVALIRQHGVSASLNRISIDTASVTANISRASSYRSWQDDSSDESPRTRFHAAVAIAVLSESRAVRADVIDAALSVLREASGSNDPDTWAEHVAHSSSARRDEIFDQTVARVAIAVIADLATDQIWHTQVALAAAVRSLAEPDERLLGALRTGEDAAVQSISELLEFLLAIFEVEIKPSYRIEQLAVTIVALIESFALRRDMPLAFNPDRPNSHGDNAPTNLLGVAMNAVFREFCAFESPRASNSKHGSSHSPTDSDVNAP